MTGPALRGPDWQPRAVHPEQPVAAAGDVPATVVVGGRLRTLMTSLLLSNTVLFAVYAGLGIILLPQQVAELDAGAKAVNLAVVTTTSSVFTLFAQPVVGALSDRTRSRFGARTPWIVLGGLGGGLITMMMQFAGTLLWITVGWVLVQVTLNAFQGPLSAVIADRIASSHRATASAMVGIGTATGIALGVVIGGRLINQAGIGYLLFGALIAAVAVLFAVLNREPGSDGRTLPPFHWGRFVRGFWVSPRRHPDYTWAFAGRFAMILGYQATTAYQLYILTDYIGLSSGRAGQVAGTLSICSALATVVSTVVFGRMSDRMGRRKIFVFLASLVMAAAVVVPLLSPSIAAMFVFAVLNGAGYGAYAAVDFALMIEVLPSSGDAARDLGILNVASNIPQAMTPPIAAVLLSLFHSYAAVFTWAAIAVVVSSFLVWPIKNAR